MIGWVLASAVFMAVGAFGPWVKGPFGEVLSGTDGHSDGWGVLACAVIGVALFLLTPNAKLAGLSAMLAGIASAAVAIWDRKDLNRLLYEDDSFSDLPQIGWGLNLAIIASVSFMVAGFAWF